MQTLRHLIALLALVAATALGGCATTARPQAGALHALAPRGALRVALYTGTPTSLLADADRRGVGYDLGIALAQLLQVRFEPLVFAKNADVLEAITSGRADVAFTNASAERALQMDFTRPYLDIELGYLVRGNAPVAELADVDHAGVRVGVTAKSSSDGVLSKALMHAEVVRAESVAAGTQMLRAGTIDLFATNKATLYEMADRVPGSRVLDGNWGIEQHALAMPKGRERGHPLAEQFIRHAIASGQVQAAVARAGLRGATVVGAEPPGDCRGGQAQPSMAEQ
jgi:polar amino acid transport system substrate-binding protein